jgi:elongation factor G
MKMLRYPKEGGKAELVDIPAEHLDKADELHNALVEKAAESDEKLMEIFFETETLNEDQIKEGLVKGVATRGLFPVFCVSAKLNMGVDRFMEFITLVAPKVTDVPAPVNNKGQESSRWQHGPASVFVFKSSMEEHIGEINYFKVMSGKITENLDVVNLKWFEGETCTDFCLRRQKQHQGTRNSRRRHRCIRKTEEHKNKPYPQRSGQRLEI